MKASELMIGDWVNIYVFPNETPKKEDLFPARINAIMTPLPSEDDIEHIECIFNTIDGGTGCASRPVDTCQPIPLTPEILEKNGFDQYGEIFVYEKKGLKIQIRLGVYVRVFRAMEMNVSFNRDFYVHHLQHALRLCLIEKEIVL